jgi:hypothetical protein
MDNARKCFESCYENGDGKELLHDGLLNGFIVYVGSVDLLERRTPEQ